MPQVPIPYSRTRIGGQEYPSPGPSAFGAGIGQELERSGQVFERIQNAYDQSEAKRIITTATAEMNGAVELNHGQIRDPDEFEATTTSQLQTIYDNALAGAKGRQTGMVQDALSNDLIRHNVAIKYNKFKKQKDIVIGNFDAEAQKLLPLAASEVEETSAGAFAEYGKQIGELHDFIGAEERQKRIQSFQDAAIRMQRNNREAAERNERDEERRTKKIAEQVEQGWYIQMAGNGISQVDLDEAKAGRNPYITPQKALEFEKKQQGVAGEGGAAVQAIKNSYYLRGVRTAQSIARARAEVSTLLNGMGGKPDEAVTKFLNELQADESEVINRGLSMRGAAAAERSAAAAETNRTIQAFDDAYDATVPKNKQLEPIFGNKAVQDKAAIADAIRKGGKEAGAAVLKEKQEGVKRRVDGVPESVNKGREALGR